MKITADTRELDTLLRNALKDYMAHTKRSLPYVLNKQAISLAVGAKGVKGLFQECASHGPATRTEIKALPARLGYRIKRGPGMTVKQEIRRRLAHAGRYQASGWLTRDITAKFSRGGATLRTVRGSIRISGGLRPVATLINNSKGALEFAIKTGYIHRALVNRARDMKRYVEDKMASDAKAFSRPTKRVHFPSIAAQLDNLTRAA